jgi:hypothetical protein
MSLYYTAFMICMPLENCICQEEFAKEMGSVLEVDLYHANPFMPLSDKMVIEKVYNFLSFSDAFGLLNNVIHNSA